MKQFDERDVLFNRISLIEGSREYIEYYENNPDYKNADDELRKNMTSMMSNGDGKKAPDMQKMMKLMKVVSKVPFIKMPSMGSMPAFHSDNPNIDKAKNKISDVLVENANKLSAKAKKANVNKEKMITNPEIVTKQVKELAKYFGGDLVGVVKLRPEHLYSHKGGIMGTGDSGKEIKLTYKYAIVVASALDKDLINRAPHAEQVLATMKGYSKSADACSNLVLYLKNLGYDSRGDNFFDYISPTTELAIDAGIGQMGRCNMCVSKEYGARLKIGAVLTNLELIPDEKIDFGLTEFCKLCGICANNCPGKAISKDTEPALNNDRIYWKHNENACMKMWMKFGTDCGVCMSSCPFSQGVDEETILKMKNDKQLMKDVILQHKEKYGNRNYIKEPLSISVFE